MLHMFFKLSMFKTDITLFVEVRNTLAPPRLISNWSTSPITLTSLFHVFLFYPCNFQHYYNNLLNFLLACLHSGVQI